MIIWLLQINTLITHIGHLSIVDISVPCQRLQLNHTNTLTELKKLCK